MTAAEDRLRSRDRGWLPINELFDEFDPDGDENAEQRFFGLLDECTRHMYLSEMLRPTDLYLSWLSPDAVEWLRRLMAAR